MTRQRTIVMLLAVFCVLLGLNLMTPGVTATPARQEDIQLAEYLIGYGSRQSSRPAEAGAAGTCPSDINGDAVVNVLDLVDLLLDFGTECPGPQVVDVAIVRPSGHEVIVRIWSDGFTEYKVTVTNQFGWGPQVWTPVPANPDAPRSRPIAATGGGGSGARPPLYRLWADGTVDRIRLFGGDGFVVPEEWITEPN